jgi:hypothetical protein
MVFDKGFTEGSLSEMDGTLIARASGYFLFGLTYENAKRFPKKGHIPMPSRRSDGRFQSLGRFA